MDRKMDLSLDEIIALNKRQKSSRGGGGRGRGGRRGSGRGPRDSRKPAETTNVQAVRKVAQQNARQVSKRARANLLNRRRNITEASTDTPAAAGSESGIGRGHRPQRGRGRGKQPTTGIRTATPAGKGRGVFTGRGRGVAIGRGRGVAIGRGIGIGSRIRRTATEGFVTIGKVAQQQAQKSTEVPAAQSSNRGRKRVRRPSSQPKPTPVVEEPQSIQISVVQDIENEPIGVELPSGFAVAHHTTKLLNERFMPAESAQKGPKRLVLPNGRAVSYHN